MVKYKVAKGKFVQHGLNNNLFSHVKFLRSCHDEHHSQKVKTNKRISLENVITGQT